eukprot:403353969
MQFSNDSCLKETQKFIDANLTDLGITAEDVLHTYVMYQDMVKQSHDETGKQPEIDKQMEIHQESLESQARIALTPSQKRMINSGEVLLLSILRKACSSTVGVDKQFIKQCTQVAKDLLGVSAHYCSNLKYISDQVIVNILSNASNVYDLGARDLEFMNTLDALLRDVISILDKQILQILNEIALRRDREEKYDIKVLRAQCHLKQSLDLDQNEEEEKVPQPNPEEQIAKDQISSQLDIYLMVDPRLKYTGYDDFEIVISSSKKKNNAVVLPQKLKDEIVVFKEQVTITSVSPFEMNIGSAQKLLNELKQECSASKAQVQDRDDSRLYQEKRVMNYDRYADKLGPLRLGSRQKISDLHQIVPSGSQFIFDSPEKVEPMKLKQHLQYAYLKRIYNRQVMDHKMRQRDLKELNKNISIRNLNSIFKRHLKLFCQMMCELLKDQLYTVNSVLYHSEMPSERGVLDDYQCYLTMVTEQWHGMQQYQDQSQLMDVVL